MGRGGTRSRMKDCSTVLVCSISPMATAPSSRMSFPGSGKLNQQGDGGFSENQQLHWSRVTHCGFPTPRTPGLGPRTSGEKKGGLASDPKIDSGVLPHCPTMQLEAVEVAPYVHGRRNKVTKALRPPLIFGLALCTGPKKSTPQNQPKMPIVS